MSHGPTPAKLLLGAIAVIALCSVGPTLIALAHALVPLVIVGGIVAVVVRLVFFHTRRW